MQQAENSHIVFSTTNSCAYTCSMHIQTHPLRRLLVLLLLASFRSRSVSIHNETVCPPPPLSSTHTHTTQLMWCPFHCWIPCRCPQHYIHPAMMSVLGSYSNSQLELSFKASPIHCVTIGQAVLEASLSLLSNHAAKLKAARKTLGSGQCGWHVFH